jgi:hypothetical protein
VIFVAVVAATVGTASFALAKGPESLTVSGPGIYHPIELDTASPGPVRRAMEQTGLWYATGGDLPSPLEEPPSKLGPGYTLTWIRYGGPGEGVLERTIRQEIYPFAEGGLVIHTPLQEGLRGWGPGVVGWFEAPTLHATLARLGVPIENVSPGIALPPREIANPSPEGLPAAAPPYFAAVSLGLVGGLVLALIAGRTLQRRAQDQRSMRAVLAVQSKELLASPRHLAPVKRNVSRPRLMSPT